MIRSNIRKLAKEQEITNPSDFGYAARIAWSTAKRMLNDSVDISGVPLVTLVKVANALRCGVEDLFEVVQ